MADNEAPAHDDGAAPVDDHHQNAAPSNGGDYGGGNGENGGGDHGDSNAADSTGEEVKLYVGNLDYGE